MKMNNEPLYQNWRITNPTFHLLKNLCILNIFNQYNSKFLHSSNVWTNSCAHHHHPLTISPSLVMVAIRPESPSINHCHPYWVMQALLNFDFVIPRGDNQLPWYLFLQLLMHGISSRPENIDSTTTLLHSNPNQSFAPHIYLEFWKVNKITLQLPLPYCWTTRWSDYWYSNRAPNSLPPMVHNKMPDNLNPAQHDVPHS